ncbi:hypothetical protein [Streptomyces sp. NPDC048720]|uniref:hypothetical protein n=1 Tax=Streptomyces sp. NPDC048720 TaxID=3365588 RepID=UPI003712E486
MRTVMSFDAAKIGKTPLPLRWELGEVVDIQFGDAAGNRWMRDNPGNIERKSTHVSVIIDRIDVPSPTLSQAPACK